MVQEQCDILFARIEFPRYFRDPRFWKRSMRRKIHTNANGRSQNSCEPGGPVAPITNERVPFRAKISLLYTHTHTHIQSSILSLSRLTLPSFIISCDIIQEEGSKVSRTKNRTNEHPGDPLGPRGNTCASNLEEPINLGKSCHPVYSCVP